MKFYEAPYYDLDVEENPHFPFSDKDATYIGIDHQYELTSAYFYERGRNLEVEVEGTAPDRVKHFLREVRLKVYNWIYTHNKSTRDQLNYMIAVRGLTGYDKYSYRQAFLEAMFVEGCYLLDNGDISGVSGVDFDTMQNMSVDVMRNQDRDMHKDAIRLLQSLGLNYYGRYSFCPKGNDW